MHTHQFFTWTTHTAETTTLLEATRLQKLYTYMCNIVTEFYLYSIVYIYLINSRLDVTFSVRHHFRISNFIKLHVISFAFLPKGQMLKCNLCPREFYSAGVLQEHIEVYDFFSSVNRTLNLTNLELHKPFNTFFSIYSDTWELVLLAC